MSQFSIEQLLKVFLPELQLSIVQMCSSELKKSCLCPLHFPEIKQAKGIALFVGFKSSSSSAYQGTYHFICPVLCMWQNRHKGCLSSDRTTILQLWKIEKLLKAKVRFQGELTTEEKQSALCGLQLNFLYGMTWHLYIRDRHHWKEKTTGCKHACAYHFLSPALKTSFISRCFYEERTIKC